MVCSKNIKICKHAHLPILVPTVKQQTTEIILTRSIIIKELTRNVPQLNSYDSITVPVDNFHGKIHSNLSTVKRKYLTTNKHN